MIPNLRALPSATQPTCAIRSARVCARDTSQHAGSRVAQCRNDRASWLTHPGEIAPTHDEIAVRGPCHIIARACVAEWTAQLLALLDAIASACACPERSR